MYIAGYGTLSRRKPWYLRVRTYVYAAVLFGTFQAGAYYNAYRQMDVVLPTDASVQRSAEYWSIE